MYYTQKLIIPPVTQAMAKLTITVSDGTNPIENANVTIGADTVLSDSNGKAEFERAYGDYKTTVSADGFVSTSKTLSFRSNHKNFSITLETQNEG